MQIYIDNNDHTQWTNKNNRIFSNSSENRYVLLESQLHSFYRNKRKNLKKSTDVNN